MIIAQQWEYILLTISILDLKWWYSEEIIVICLDLHHVLLFTSKGRTFLNHFKTADKNITSFSDDLCILPDLCKLLLTCSPSTAFLSPLFFFDRCLDSCRWILDWRGFRLHCLRRQTYASRRQQRALWKHKTLTQF